MNCRVAWWLRGLGDGHWPQVWDLPKIPTHERPDALEVYEDMVEVLVVLEIFLTEDS